MPQDEMRFDELKGLLADVQRDILAALALQGEGYAKVAITDAEFVDTGFARNSIQGIPPNGEARRPEAVELRSGKRRGRPFVKRESAVVDGMEDDEAAIVCAADYAIHLVVKNDFLATAATQLRGDVGGIVDAVKRQRGLA